MAAESAVLGQGGVVARLVPLYGPGRCELVRRYLAGEPCLPGGAGRCMNYVHRDDAVAALRLLAADGEGVYNLCGESFTKGEMYARLHAAYGAMAAKYGFDVIPVGTAAEYIPNREALFKKGDSHFGREGVYLQGLTFTASLYGVDVGKCPYRPKWMSPSRAEEMKSAVLSAGAANLPARLPPTGAPSKK